MTIDEHIGFLNRAIVELGKTQAEDALLSTLDLIGLIKLRLAEQGTRADGSAFSDYSPIYGKVRQSKGLQTGRKDFNVTGQLYNSIRPEITGQSVGEVRASITVRGSDNQLKVKGQIKRDGVIIEPSKGEVLEIINIHTPRRFARAQQLLTQ